MNLRRIGILFGRELRASTGNFLMVFAVIMPLVFSLLIGLVFGDLFSGKPVLGFYDLGNSRITSRMAALPQLKTSQYDSLDEMIADVELGAIETGYVIPQGFDKDLKAGMEIDFPVYTWGETPLKNRLIADTALANIISDLAGLERNVTVEIRQLGQADQTSLADQLLPLLIIMTIMMGGILVPALSMITEKQNHTLGALNVTPAALSEVFAAKVLLGTVLGTSTSLMTLAVNQAFGSHPLLLVFVLMFGALTASIFGALLGALLKDMNVLLAVLKTGGILLMAPGILDMIPKAPDWIARFFPTYYIIHPVMQVAQRGMDLVDVAGDLLILLAIMGGLVLALAMLIERQKKGVALL